MPTKLLLVAGARPNFMKIAPLIKAIDRHNEAPAAGTSDSRHPASISYSLVHTGQHYDEKMSDVFFRELRIPAPHHNLAVGSGSHAEQTARIMLAFEPVLLSERPDWVVVVGDVNSTAACALVAAKLGIRVAHVEAGLRSFDRSMPEEINRLVTDSIADLLLTPSADADDNLRREGVPESRIRLVGNIMIDSLVENLPRARQSGILRRLGLAAGAYAFVTIHRPANVDQRPVLAAIMQAIETAARAVPVVFALHPRTRKMLATHDLALPTSDRFKIIDPVGYHDSLCLIENARFILTDSGGLQEESTYFRTPCLTLRPNTERPVTISLGSNRLTSHLNLASDIESTLTGNARLGSLPPFWDGKSAERIVAALQPVV
ncbi:UDP-N-acetylglucosamine 2-epimerase (non-hydrolyzing) [bacterium]|nr:UDP-N-acetylglucosamine 2-epimerase (non-hydrolyzing) [bacterium]